MPWHSSVCKKLIALCSIISKCSFLFLFFCSNSFLVWSLPDHGKGISHSGELIDLYGKIQKIVEDIALNGGNKKRITIILDDFSLIEVATDGSFSHSLDFLQYCYTLTSENVRGSILFFAFIPVTHLIPFYLYLNINAVLPLQLIWNRESH